MNILVIAEKRNAAQRIAKILSKGKVKTIKKGRESYYEFTKGTDHYYVVPLRGHILELDYGDEFKRWNLEDLQKLVEAQPRKIVKEKGIAKILRELGKKVEEVIVATDYDREGELIGVEALSILNFKGPVKRAKFSALTEEEITNAFTELVDINYALASAAEARQHIDLAWGASLTRFVSLASGRRGKDYLSVGRVQSPTLALIVEREKEIEKFVPKPYWNIIARFQKRRIFIGTHERNPFWKKEEVNSIFEKIKAKKGKVVEYRKKKKKIRPPIPFNTTEFLSEATKLGFSAARAMRIAEDLYMGGYISYPRTDNTVYPKSLNINSILKSLEKSNFANLVENLRKERRKYPTRGKIESKDHPPIVPTRGAKLDGERGLIYELVVRRFLATLAPDMEYEEKKAIINVEGENFISVGREILNSGWLKYYIYAKFNEVKIPELKVGEEVKVKEIKVEEKKTKPPSRYTQSSLIKEMEKLNLGTKSTRAEIIQKLFDRGYIRGNPIRPTKLGMALVETLRKSEVQVVKPDMTAKLEKDMNRIEKGEIGKEKVIEESKAMLQEVLKNLNVGAFGEKMRESMRYKIGECPDGGELIYIERKRLVVCEREDGTTFYNLPKTGHVEILERKCPVCGLPLIKVVRKGQSPEIRCLNSKCEYNIKKDVVGKCPKCGGDLVIRQSRNGKRFIGCSNYPRCDVTYPLPQKGKIIPTGETCPYCGAPLIIIRKKGKKDWKLCPNMGCDYNKRGREDEE